MRGEDSSSHPSRENQACCSTEGGGEAVSVGHGHHREVPASSVSAHSVSATRPLIRNLRWCSDVRRDKACSPDAPRLALISSAAPSLILLDFCPPSPSNAPLPSHGDESERHGLSRHSRAALWDIQGHEMREKTLSFPPPWETAESYYRLVSNLCSSLCFSLMAGHSATRLDAVEAAGPVDSQRVWDHRGKKDCFYLPA